MSIQLPRLPIRQLLPWFKLGSQSWKICLLALFLGSLSLFGWLSLNFPQLAQALTVTQTYNSTVTASVGDFTPPSTPILISPSDGSWVTTQKPTFTWYPSTDNIGVHHYQLIIDGSVVIDNISQSSNPSVTVTNSLSEGGHTWKVMVFDAAGNSNTSATWSFSIDSQAPSFVLKQLGDKSVSISAQDSSTWPTTPYTVTTNPAPLLATTENNSQVTVTVSWGGQIRQTFTSSSSSEQWQAILGLVPRDEIITLDFLIRDHVDLVSVLEGVQFIVPSFDLPPIGGGLSPTNPPTVPSPTLLPGEPTLPAPALTTPEPSVVVPPSPPGSFTWSWPGGTTTQFVEAPSLPWFQEILLTISLHLPDPIARPLENTLTTPPVLRPVWLSSLAVWLWLLGPLLAWLWWLTIWGKDWWTVGGRGWWSILGWWRPKRHGWVLEDTACRPVEGVKITVFARTLASLEPIKIETIFSDFTGQFALPQWPPPALTGQNGQYSLSFELPGSKQPGAPLVAEFAPTPSDWPSIFTPFTYWHHRYHGGWLSLRRDYEFPTLVSFLQKLESQPHLATLIHLLGRALTNWSQQRGGWWWFVLITSLLASALWGGWWNWLVVSHTMVVGLSRWWKVRSLKVWSWQLPATTALTDSLAGMIVTSRQTPSEAWWVPAASSHRPMHQLSLALPPQITTGVVQPLPLQSAQPFLAAQLGQGDPLAMVSQFAEPRCER